MRAGRHWAASITFDHDKQLRAGVGATLNAPTDIPGYDSANGLAALITRRENEILSNWVRLQTRGDAPLGGGGSEAAITAQARELLGVLHAGLERSGQLDIARPEFAPLREVLAERSRRGVRDAATPTETAQGLLALREALFAVIRTEHAEASDSLAETTIAAGRIVDAMALLSFDNYVRGREEIILRQSTQLLELSTPVVRLWDGVVGLPLVGTLDSSRAQVVMESVLEALVHEDATVAIIDITGVPAVDTLVAQHLFKTVTATRLMGADCIISGIRPQTAQTIVQLGVDLTDITTRATLADALSTAIERVADRRDRHGRVAGGL